MKEQDYRYSWSPKDQPEAESTLCIVGFNPSSADDGTDDPTTRAMRRIADELGHDRLIVVNLYAARATDPADLQAMADRGAGIMNDVVISEAASGADQVLAAWGNAGVRARISGYTERLTDVLELLRDVQLWAKGINSDGSPRHPLYSADVVVPWPAEAGPGQALLPEQLESPDRSSV